MAGKRQPRADAARNRDRLAAAGAAVFGERGLDAPLEEIARRAGVSIGTLYNHFPTRQDLLDAIFPARLAALEEVAERSLADPDPWNGFVAYVEGLFELQARDRGLNDVLARRLPDDSELGAACRRGFASLEQAVDRAKRSGRLRADFEPQDVMLLMWAMSQVIRESVDVAPDVWRRCLGFFLDGLRPEAAHPLTAAPLGQVEVMRLMGGGVREGG